MIAEAKSSIPKPASLKVPVEQDETEETEKDDKMKKLASELARAGDALVLEYGPTVKVMLLSHSYLVDEIENYVHIYLMFEACMQGLTKHKKCFQSIQSLASEMLSTNCKILK